MHYGLYIPLLKASSSKKESLFMARDSGCGKMGEENAKPVELWKLLYQIGSSGGDGDAGA
jgi:hypothetical protein